MTDECTDVTLKAQFTYTKHCLHILVLLDSINFLNKELCELLNDLNDEQ